jgi:hypothetical protein
MAMLPNSASLRPTAKWTWSFRMNTMNGDDAAQLQAPLKFLGRGKWTLRSRQDVNGKSAFTLSLGPAGALRES